MSEVSTISKLQLSDGNLINIEVKPIGDQKISSSLFSFDKVKETILTFSKDIANLLTDTADKTTIKFGVGLSLDTSGLSALIVKGSSKANLEITLEWNSSEQPNT